MTKNDSPLADLAAAYDAEAAADQQVRDAIEAARDAGISWDQIARSVGVSVDSIRWRIRPEAAKARRPSAKRKLERSGSQVLEQATPFEHEIGVTEAAEACGVTRITIHRWAQEGRVVARADRTGSRMVLRIAANEAGQPITGQP